MLPSVVAVETFGQTDVANFHDAVFAIDVGGFQIPMHNSAIVKMSYPGDKAGQPVADFTDGKSVRE
jgi:hypothetical protein